MNLTFMKFKISCLLDSSNLHFIALVNDWVILKKILIMDFWLVLLVEIVIYQGVNSLIFITFSLNLSLFTHSFKVLIVSTVVISPL